MLFVSLGGGAKLLALDQLSAIRQIQSGYSATIVVYEDRANAGRNNLLDVDKLYPELSLADIATQPRIVYDQVESEGTDQDLYLILSSDNPFKDDAHVAVGAGEVMIPTDMLEAVVACSTQQCKTGHFHDVPNVKFLHLCGKVILRYFCQYEDADGMHDAARYILTDGQRVSFATSRNVIQSCAELGIDAEADFFDQTGLIDPNAWSTI